MKLIPEWRDAWRWFSVHALGLIVLLPLVWAEMPPEVMALIPASWHPYIVAAVAAAGLVGRMVDQRPRP